MEVLGREGVGCIVFSPLAQGLLSEKYLNGIPAGSRASKTGTYLSHEDVTPQAVDKARRLSRNRSRPRTEAGPDGAGLELAAAGGDLGSGGRQPSGAGGGKCAGAGEIGFFQ